MAQAVEIDLGAHRAVAAIADRREPSRDVAGSPRGSTVQRVGEHIRVVDERDAGRHRPVPHPRQVLADDLDTGGIQPHVAGLVALGVLGVDAGAVFLVDIGCFVDPHASPVEVEVVPCQGAQLGRADAEHRAQPDGRAHLRPVLDPTVLRSTLRDSLRRLHQRDHLLDRRFQDRSRHDGRHVHLQDRVGGDELAFQA